MEDGGETTEDRACSKPTGSSRGYCRRAARLRLAAKRMKVKYMSQSSFPALNPPRRILMGPGPSDTHPRVLAALGAPTVGHLDPYFLQVMNETQSMLRQVFQTQNALTLALSGTGRAGVATYIVTHIEPR